MKSCTNELSIYVIPSGKSSVVMFWHINFLCSASVGSRFDMLLYLTGDIPLINFSGPSALQSFIFWNTKTKFLTCILF